MNPDIQQILSELGDFGSRNKGYFNIPADTGKFLYNLALISKAKNMLEVGTSNGYSTIWIAQAALQNKGRVTTIEILEEKVKLAKENFKRARLDKVITQIKGDALAEMPKLKQKFDFIFIDAIKKDYIKYLTLAEKNLKKGTIIAADNAIIFKEKMSHYLNYLQNNKNYSSVLVPIGTGVEFSLKIK